LFAVALLAGQEGKLRDQLDAFRKAQEQTVRAIKLRDEP
jgi:hypothetical protein